ncbi:MAG: DNA/RNA non-specific endonuclease [Clostridia bacterium]|nr:DNA/RNA non-specific endonuclease [Clostridia bacterium]
MKNRTVPAGTGILFLLILIAALVITFLPLRSQIRGSRQTTVPSPPASVNAERARAHARPVSGFDPSVLPPWDGEHPSVPLNDNIPFFTGEELTADSFEYYSPLDSLGRCGYACASVGRDLMPTQKRERISGIHPTGWHHDRYDFIEGELLYNRCHLLAYQLTGENANERNLITGTRYLNADGMEPYESKIGDYIRRTGNHVFYRVTPVFSGRESLARGVLLEALSVEDQGRGIRFCVYCYNVQPDIQIDYRTGDNRLNQTGNQTNPYYATQRDRFHNSKTGPATQKAA